MNKILDFITLSFYVLGVIGGTGYACYNQAYPIAIGVLVTGALALPQVKEIFEDLTR